jgi:hypothetical protein
MRFYEIHQIHGAPQFSKLAGWDGQEVYLPLALFECDVCNLLIALDDRIRVIDFRGHLYAPSKWIGQRLGSKMPYFETAILNIKSMLINLENEEAQLCKR